MSEHLVEEIVASDGRITVVANRAFHDRFLAADFFVQFEDSGVPSSIGEPIALVPFLFNVAPVVWLSGRTYTVPNMDGSVAASLESLRDVFRRHYPELSWRGQIVPERVTSEAEYGPREQGPLGVLFSGGLDSVFESASARDRKQLLIHVFGVDEPLDHPQSKARARCYCIEFAREFGHKTAFIESNLRWFLSREWLLAMTGAGFNWWTRVQHEMGFVGLAIPLCVQQGVSELRLGGAAQAHFGEPHGTHPEISRQIHWGPSTLVQDGSSTPRQEKLRTIIEHSRGRATPIQLRVCTDQEAVENCGRCEKCLRTATGLVALGEPPETYGFPFSETESLRVLRSAFRSYSLKLPAMSNFLDWFSIQCDLRKRLSQMLEASSRIEDESEEIRWFAFFDLWRYRNRAPGIQRRQAVLRLLSRPDRPVRWLVRRLRRALQRRLAIRHRMDSSD